MTLVVIAGFGGGGGGGEEGGGGGVTRQMLLHSKCHTVCSHCSYDSIQEHYVYYIHKTDARS